ncbi:DUF3710 domain-containing protein [Dermatophilaceae bacterium Sec6.4]|nr:DUF3710 domain-containing protein [Actinomycetota bacterium]
MTQADAAVDADEITDPDEVIDADEAVDDDQSEVVDGAAGDAGVDGPGAGTEHAAADIDTQYTRLPRPFDLDRTQGPFDRSEVDELGDRLDFGALAVQPVAGMELRLDLDEATGSITGLTAVLGNSAAQVQVFAAPKSSGIWDDIRDEIADGLITGGGSATEQRGPLGIELAVRIPSRDASGRTTYSAARFAGVDGPRWFLRAVYSGAAATDEEAAAALLMFIRNVVVLRGSAARAPRELLELKVPESLIEAAEQEAADAADNGSGTDSADSEDIESFKPFERGPEITEVR